MRFEALSHPSFELDISLKCLSIIPLLRLHGYSLLAEVSHDETSASREARVLNGYGVQFFFLRLGDGDALGAPNEDMVQNHLTKHC